MFEGSLWYGFCKIYKKDTTIFTLCMVSLLFIGWYGCRGCREKFESSIEYNSFFWVLLILVSQPFNVIRKLTVFRKM